MQLGGLMLSSLYPTPHVTSPEQLTFRRAGAPDTQAALLIFVKLGPFPSNGTRIACLSVH